MHGCGSNLLTETEGKGLKTYQKTKRNRNDGGCFSLSPEILLPENSQQITAVTGSEGQHAGTQENN